MQDCVYKGSSREMEKSEDNSVRCHELTGKDFSDLILAAERHLSLHKKEVDALNVFPVPDGDTGTNMSLTLASAASSTKRSALIKGEPLGISQVSDMVSNGALMGARGNSGVILSQILRGIAKGFSGKESCDARDLANALDQAVAVAYKAVMKPTEGTILTVLRAARDSVLNSVEMTQDIASILDKALVDAKTALDRTPEQLPVLKQAGVVDAGGKGLVLILEAFRDRLYGRVSDLGPYPLEEISEKTPEPREAKVPALPQVSSDTEIVGKDLDAPGPELMEAKITEEDILAIENPYDTQFLLRESSASPEEVRRQIETMGDSVLVVGTKELLRVHVHTKTPGEVLTYCLKYGVLSQVTIDNMIEQSKEVLSQKKKKDEGVFEDKASSKEVFQEIPVSVSSPKDIAVVSVATGQGLKDIMKSLGCDLVIDGGDTMNPSTSDLLDAVKSLQAKKIIFIPNNGNIFLTAKQAKKLFGRNMYIVPSRTIPQGISALLSLNLEEDMEHNLKRAGKAVKAVRTGEVTFSARDGKFGRYVMKKGDVLGLIDGKVETLGQNPEDVLRKIVKAMAQKEDAVVTIYYGHDRTEDQVKAGVQSIRDDLGQDAEIEFHNGGQLLYYYIVSCE